MVRRQHSPQELHERFAAALDRPSRVEQATMGHVEAVTDQFRRLDDRIGSRDLLGPMLGHLRFITRLLQRRTRPGRAGWTRKMLMPASTTSRPVGGRP